MATERTKLEIVNETPRNTNKDQDPKALEHIFGKPNSPKKISDSHLTHSKPHNNTENMSQPLLEPDREKQKPPLAGPEIDDLDDEVAAFNNNNNNNHSVSGIDDGLLEPVDKKPDIIDVGDDINDPDGGHGKDGKNDGDTHTEDGKWPWHSDDEPDYPYDHNSNGGLSPRFGFDDRPVSPIPSFIDVNTYQQKKNLAQGMMDLALLSANANQLRYVLESASTHPYYYPSLVFISLSIIFQIAVGIGLIMNSRYDVNDKKEICKADKINNFTVLGIFLITIVNVFITSFSVATPTTTAVVPAG